jgi:hypothetical protein
VNSPHNWASAEFVRLVRHLLVLERGDEIELLTGLPEEWLVPGQRVRLERTPTRFGPVTLQVEREAPDIVRIEVERDVGWPRRPERVLLHVPAAWRVVSTTVDGEASEPGGQTAAVVELPDRERIVVALSPRAT